MPLARGEDSLDGMRPTRFDNYVRNPKNPRLHDWLNFDASDARQSNAQDLALKSKLDDVRAGQEAGRIDIAWDPAQLLIMLSLRLTTKTRSDTGQNGFSTWAKGNPTPDPHTARTRRSL